MKKITFLAALILLPCLAKANYPMEDLQSFAKNSGEYVIDPASGSYCREAYQELQLVVDPARQTVTETFIGKGTMNGLPTEGRQELEVSLTKETELPSFPGRKTQRTVVIGNSIVHQEWEWSPFANRWGGWETRATLLEFLDSQSVRLSYYHCKFLKKTN